MTPLPILAEKSESCGGSCGCGSFGCGSDSATTGSTLIDLLLAEQQSLSAVEQFSKWHSGTKSRSEPYRSLLPATAPGPGQQYAFEVDLDRCSGCKACVVACHTLNGLDENETWRDVGLMIGGSRHAPVMQHVTSACHHCLEPACMTACPVNAYEKDPVTGIVKHLDDQCFGCQYCTLACPYDVPKYHAAKGIVRKCDMCSSRLAVGEPPACVQACPHEAITIQIVDQKQVAEDAEAAVFLPAAPDPQITLPTTNYKTRKVFPRNLLPADYFRVNPQHAHWPLVIMLVLTQLSVGAFIAWLALEPVLSQNLTEKLRPLHAASALGFGLLALVASLFHLGRPQYAMRAVLGLGHSWLSREIVAFGLFAGLASAYACAVIFAEIADRFVSAETYRTGVEVLGWSVAASGILAVFCSTMIYVFTRRECWTMLRTGIRFFMTSAVLGLATVWLSILVATLVRPSDELNNFVDEWGATLCQILIGLTAGKLIWEAAIFWHLLNRKMTPLQRSAMLLTNELSNATLARFALGILGGILMPILLLNQVESASEVAQLVKFVAVAGILFAACIAGELLERYLFFAACATPRMPGGLR
jgi:formate dehydrogenase iron-sulfur subunit